ncbi:MAG TPA: M48 family metalloprotease [Gemmatimonadales bacterium]|nr:M48 family metalloprotease [Gemmatimonadales bacterium]
MRHVASRRFLAWAIAMAVMAAGIITCATNPVTGKRELSLVSESQEISMGQQYAGQVVQEMGPYPDSTMQAYVSGIGKEIAVTTERPKLPWTFTVIDDPTVNAFALPGGFIFVTRGILTHMNSEAELATVVGHEIGHVTARHSVQQMTRQQLAQLGMVAGAIASEEIAQNLGVISQGLGVLFLKYSRDDESQADGLGFRYALNDGYDVRKMVNMFQILQRISARAGQRIPEWQSTHPDPGNRIEATQARLARVTVPLDGKKVNREPFLRVIDGMIFGENPRQGFFRGTTFLHPDLAFQLEFPPGWQTANQMSAVTGVSPKQDAQVQLSLAGTDAPASTLQKFLSQQGIQAGRPTQGTLNGNPVAYAPFTAQNQDGSTISGLVAYASYEGNTYQLLGLTNTSYATYDRTFQGFVTSFRRLTDPAVLSIKPNRIQVTRVRNSMTLAAFNQQNPSVIPLDELALINGLADGNAMLVAGESVKRVVAK